VWFVACISGLLLGTASAAASDLKLHTRLVWGTDQGQPAGKNLQEIDDKTRAKLHQFKWKHYWVMNQCTADTNAKEHTKVSLSDKGAVDFKDLGNGSVEIRLYDLKTGSEPKRVKVVQHSIEALKKGELCILAGDDKETWDNAWFVIITAAP
jgi:hypothetical protein